MEAGKPAENFYAGSITALQHAHGGVTPQSIIRMDQ